jgi:hypothetical protein
MNLFHTFAAHCIDIILSFDKCTNLYNNTNKDVLLLFIIRIIGRHLIGPHCFEG